MNKNYEHFALLLLGIGGLLWYLLRQSATPNSAVTDSGSVPDATSQPVSLPGIAPLAPSNITIGGNTTVTDTGCGCDNPAGALVTKQSIPAPVYNAAQDNLSSSQSTNFSAAPSQVLIGENSKGTLIYGAADYYAPKGAATSSPAHDEPILGEAAAG